MELALRQVLTPVWQKIRLDRNERSGQPIHEIHRRSWNRFTEYIYEHSPYYRRIMDRHGLIPGEATVETFPVLTKSELMEHYDEILTDRSLNLARLRSFLAQDHPPGTVLDDRYHVIHTSGSSGEIGVFVYNDQEWSSGAIHFSRFASLKPFRKVAYVGACGGHYAGISLSQNFHKGVGKLFYRLATFDVTQPLEDLKSQIDTYKPEVMTAYGATLKLLAEAQRAGEIQIGPQEIFSVGEPLLAGEAEMIEQAFGVRPVNVYASSEHLVMGVVPPGEEQMVLFEDQLIFEFNEDCTYVTNLFNHTLPMVRYRMDDVLQPAEEGAPQGSRFAGYRRVHPVFGRKEYAPTFRNDEGQMEEIHPIVFVEFYVPGLKKFQLELRGERRFNFRSVIDDAFPETQVLMAIRQQLQEILRSKGMNQVEFSIQVLKEIPVNPKTGKFQLVVFSDPS